MSLKETTFTDTELMNILKQEEKQEVSKIKPKEFSVLTAESMTELGIENLLKVEPRQIEKFNRDETQKLDKEFVMKWLQEFKDEYIVKTDDKYDEAISKIMSPYKDEEETGMNINRYKEKDIKKIQPELFLRMNLDDLLKIKPSQMKALSLEQIFHIGTGAVKELDPDAIIQWQKEIRENYDKEDPHFDKVMWKMTYATLYNNDKSDEVFEAEIPGEKGFQKVITKRSFFRKLRFEKEPMHSTVKEIQKVLIPHSVFKPDNDHYKYTVYKYDDCVRFMEMAYAETNQNLTDKKGDEIPPKTVELTEIPEDFYTRKESHQLLGVSSPATITEIFKKVGFYKIDLDQKNKSRRTAKTLVRLSDLEEEIFKIKKLEELSEETKDLVVKELVESIK